MRNLKRALSLAVASVMLLGMMVVGSSAAGYPDVTSADNVEAIEVLQAIGVMAGDDQGNFNPDKVVSRNEMAVIMTRLLNLSEKDFAGVQLTFTDVPEWAAPYVAACQANSIIGGYSATIYGGDDPVTAGQAALMVMKALGYFQFQQDFGDDWQLATIKQASEINLFDGINTSATAGLTRNEVARLVLNALEADVVDYSGSAGTDITTSDGTNINIGYTIKYDGRYDTDYDYNGEDYTLQLIEKLYKDKVEKNASSTDDFGRLATTWKYDNKVVGDYAQKADLTYTSATKGKDIYADLGKPTGFVIVGIDDVVGKYTEDGVATVLPAGFSIAAGVDDKIGADGQTIEVYYDKDADEIRIVVINYYFDEITGVGENDDKERVVKIGALEYVTESFDEGDKVIYTQANGEIKTMVAAEKLTGTLTKTVGDNEYYIDGVKYKLSDSAAVGSVEVKKDVEYYLANGYIIKIDPVNEDVSVDDLAYVISADDARGAYAVLRLADGTKITVDTDKVYDGSDGDDLVGRIVSFKDGKDGYELKDKSEATIQASAVTNDFTKGVPTLTLADGTEVKTDSQTVFLYNVDGKVTVYTGYKNAPTLTNDSQIVYYRESANKAAVLVYVETAAVDNASKDLTFVAYNGDVKLVDDGDNKYYEYNAIVDGKITTIKVDESQWSSVDGSVIAVFDAVKYSDDDIATGLTPYDPTKYVSFEVDAAHNTEAAKNDVITLNGEALAYADDVKVFIVDKDKNIAAGTISSLKKDDGTKYDSIVYTQNKDDAVDLLIIVEK